MLLNVALNPALFVGASRASRCPQRSVARALQKCTLAAAFLAVVCTNALGITYTTLDHPLVQPSSVTGLSTGTNAIDISNNVIVGMYTGAGGLPHGFTYDGSTYTTVDHPLAVKGTWLTGIDGTNMVGYYLDSASKYHGFLYNGSFAAIDIPSATYGTLPYKIEGSNVVGVYAFGFHGFLYDGSTFTTLDVPASVAPGNRGTQAYGTSGTTIVGKWDDQSLVSHGFIYNGSTYSALNHPSASSAAAVGGTWATDVSGSMIVGYYYTGVPTVYRGFLYNGSSFTPIDVPGANGGTVPGAISGSSVVGTYTTFAPAAGFRNYGFVAITPEPGAFSLIAIGTCALAIAGHRRLRKSSSRSRASH